MASRKKVARTKLPLEWKTQTLSTAASATSVVDTIDLDLLQDEVAEIHKVRSHLHFASGTMPNVDGHETIAAVLSMDPSISTTLDPIAAVVQEDLESWFIHEFERQNEAAGTVNNLVSIKSDDQQDSDFVPPVLLGTNVGMLLQHVSTTITAVSWVVTLYFTRRLATVQELNQILLKRR